MCWLVAGSCVSVALGGIGVLVWLQNAHHSDATPATGLLPGMQPWSSAEVSVGDIGGQILAIGDWGCGLDVPAGCPDASGQKLVAKAMASHAAKNSIDFILNLGDSFYPKGVSSIDDERWDSTFTNMYSSKHLQLPWYGVLGNHDWVRNASALVSKHGRWHIPALSYTVKGRAAGVAFTFFMIDANVVINEDICTRRHFSDWGPLEPDEFVICEKSLVAIFQSQLQWLTHELQKASSDVKIVVGHEPVYAVGKWAFAADSPGVTLWEHLDPILHRRGVHAYLSGHDHLFQHLSKHGIDYYVNGAGGGELDDGLNMSTARDANVVANFAEYGFSHVDINKTHLCMSFFATDIASAKYKHCKPHGVAAQISE